MTSNYTLLQFIFKRIDRPKNSSYKLCDNENGIKLDSSNRKTLLWLQYLLTNGIKLLEFVEVKGVTKRPFV